MHPGAYWFWVWQRRKERIQTQAQQKCPRENPDDTRFEGRNSAPITTPKKMSPTPKWAEYGTEGKNEKSLWNREIHPKHLKVGEQAPMKIIYY